MGRARVQIFNPGEMPLVILAMLEDRSRNGHELMTALRQELPSYKPSPGTIYPALTALRAEGLIADDDHGGRGAHRLTPAGVALLAAKRDLLTEIRSRVRAAGATDDQVGQLLEEFNERVRRVDQAVDGRRVERILERAALAIERLGTDGAT